MFELEPGAECSEVSSGQIHVVPCPCSPLPLQDDVSLARYVAEAISTLDFKRLEEPMRVISHLNSSLAVAGLQVLHQHEGGIEGGGSLLSGTPASSPSEPRVRS